MNDLSKACLDEARNSMQTAISFLEKELAKIRAGKANPGMLDGVKVDYYGTPTELSQAANINTPDARSIIIQPWDKSILGAINKAIIDANLGFTPRHEGEILRIAERDRSPGRLVKETVGGEVIETYTHGCHEGPSAPAS